MATAGELHQQRTSPHTLKQTKRTHHARLMHECALDEDGGRGKWLAVLAVVAVCTHASFVSVCASHSGTPLCCHCSPVSVSIQLGWRVVRPRPHRWSVPPVVVDPGRVVVVVFFTRLEMVASSCSGSKLKLMRCRQVNASIHLVHFNHQASSGRYPMTHGLSWQRTKQDI